MLYFDSWSDLKSKTIRKWQNYRRQTKVCTQKSISWTSRRVIPLSSETKKNIWQTTVLAQQITPTPGPGRLHRLNTLSTLTSAAGSEALYEAGVQVSRGQWLVFSEDLLAGHVWLQANWGLPAQEVQHSHRSDHEPGRDRLHGGRQRL